MTRILDELKRQRDMKYCVGVDANNDCCGVTFTCWPCRERARLTTAIDEAEGFDQIRMDGVEMMPVTERGVTNGG